MAAGASARKGIKDVFYETRVLLGREYTLRRFAGEVLGGAVDPVMLGYIEKGKRFPSEGLVRRLASLRKQDPHELLALLWRDRMLHAFGRELRRVLRSPQGVGGIEDADLAVVVSQAIAALPEDGGWITLSRWRRAYRTPPRRRGQTAPAATPPIDRVEAALLERGLVELRGGKVRRHGHHFVAESAAERRALALEFCALFVKGLLDKLALADADTGTYLRNHYFYVDPDTLPEIQRRIDEAITKIADEYARGPSPARRFLNVLITATPF